MATTTTKKTNSNANVENKQEAFLNEEKVYKEENQQLKDKIQEMEAQLSKLIQQLDNVTKVSNNNEPKKEKNITFINLTPGTLVLKGSQVWKIEGQFTQRVFLEREARIILNNMPNTIRTGLVYIADNDFIRENDLEEIYQILLDDKQMKNLFNQNFDKVIEIYKSAPKSQQQIIIKMIKNKKSNGEYIDANILIQLGKLCGEDLLNIEADTEE